MRGKCLQVLKPQTRQGYVVSCVNCTYFCSINAV